MAGAHIHWHKRAFRVHWVLRGAPGCAGSIAAVRDTPDAATAYAWSVSRRGSARASDPVASGVAATLSDARLLASRAAFAALPMPVECPETVPAWTRGAAR